MATRFESFARMLYDIGAAKWPVATVNWATYTDVLGLAEEIKTRLSARGDNLIQKDMIDVQSFIWVVGAFDA